MKKMRLFICLTGSFLLLLSACSNPSTDSSSAGAVSTVSDTSYSSGTTVAATEEDFFKTLAAAVPALTSLSFSDDSADTVSDSVSSVKNQVRNLVAPSQSARSELTAGIYLKGSNDVTFKPKSSPLCSPSGSYSFSVQAETTNNFTTEELRNFVNYVDEDLNTDDDGLSVLTNNEFGIGLNGFVTLSVKDSAVNETDADSNNATVTLDKAVLSVSGLKVSLKTTDLSIVYHDGSDTDNPESVVTADYTLGGKASVNLAFVLSSDDTEIPGGRIGMTVTFDKEITFTEEDAVELGKNIDNADDMNSKLMLFATFLADHNLSLGDVSVAAAVYDNSNTETFAKTYTIAEFGGKVSALFEE